MRNDAKKQPQFLLAGALGGLAVLLSLAAFVGWIVQGPEMFLAMAENGLSWCF